MKYKAMKKNSAPTHAESFARLNELISDIHIAMLTTVTADGTLRSRPMATQQIDLIDGVLWFFSSSDSPKNDEILHQRQVNLAYMSVDKQRYVSVSGEAQIVRDKTKTRQLWKPAAKTRFPDGVDDPNLVLLRVEVTSAEYWDSPSSKMVQFYGLAKLAFTGKPNKTQVENVQVDITAGKS